MHQGQRQPRRDRVRPCTARGCTKIWVPGGRGGPGLEGCAPRIWDTFTRDTPRGSGGLRCATNPPCPHLDPGHHGQPEQLGDDHEARKEGMQILHNRKSKPGSSDTYIICNVLDNSGLNISGNLLPCHYSLPLRWAARHESLEIWKRARSSDDGGLIMALIFIECIPASPS